MARSQLAVLAACGVAVALACSHKAQAGLVPVSIDAEGARHHVRYHAISHDGRLVAFTAHRWPGFEKRLYGEDVFVLDRVTGTVYWASVSSDGAEGEGGGTDTRDSIYPAVASDGRSVVFQSNATNFFLGDSYDTMDVFVHDLETAETILASRSSTGEPANAESLRPTISNDGRFVAFESLATNLDGVGFGGAFIHDRLMGTTTRVSIAHDGNPMAGARPVLSGNGRYVAFMGSIPGDKTSYGIYLRDRESGTTEKLPITPEVTDAGSPSYPQISDDGRVIAFLATRWEFPHWVSQIFRHDRMGGETTRIGTLEQDYEEISLSGNGRYVAYIPPQDSEGNRPCLLFDSTTGAISRIDVANSSASPTDQCFPPRLAQDASVITFTHFTSTGLIPCGTVHTERTAVLYLVDVAEPWMCGAESGCGVFQCDDGDSCTVDSCTEGYCSSEPLAWTAESATCILPPMPASCEGVLPKQLHRQLERIAQRLARIENATAGRRRALVRRVEQRLGKTQKRVQRLASRNKLDQTCAADLGAALAVAQQRVVEL